MKSCGRQMVCRRWYVRGRMSETVCRQLPPLPTYDLPNTTYRALILEYSVQVVLTQLGAPLEEGELN
jgi:hypothetical protein